MTLSDSLVVPAVAVRVAGEDLDCRLLSAARVRREAAAPAACELRFEDPTGDALDDVLDQVVAGMDMEVRVGDEAGALFRGDVLTVEHRYAADGLRQVLLRAQDRAHRWRQDRRIRAFVAVTVGDLIAEVAEEVGLTAEIEEPGPRWPRFLQDGRSTLDLVTDLAQRAGLTWQVDAGGTRVRVTAAAQASGQAVVLAHGADLLEATVRLTAVAAHEEWRMTGWDPVTGAISDEVATADPSPDAVGDVALSTGVRSGALFADSEHAEHAARAQGVRTAGNARTLRAVALGDPRLVPGARVRLAGLADTVAGEYLLTATDHVIDAVGGYLCVLRSAPPPASPDVGAPAARMTIADVVRVDDPEQRGRVKVSLLGLAGLESEWLPVLALGAGADKGITCQPDVGDRVVLTHEPQDPGRGVVLGALRTEAGSEPAAGVGDGSVRTYAMRLPGGQQVRLATEDDEASLGNGAGSQVVLTAEGTRVHSVGDLVIEAPGHRIVLRAQAIDMERG